MAAGLTQVAGRRARAAVLVVYAVLSVADVGAELADQRLLITLLPLGLMPLLVAYVVLSVRRSWMALLLVVGLVFAWFGDSIPGSPLLMIGLFAVTQIAYVVAFLPRWRHSLLVRRWPLVAYGVPMSALILAVGSQAGSIAGPVVVYGLLVTTMVVLASGVNGLCCSGAVLFLLSDITLGCRLFVAPADTPVLGSLVMATYLTGQLLITLGVLHTLRTSRKTAATGLVSARR